MPSAAQIATVCQNISALLPGRVAYPGNNTYQTFAESYWSLQESTLDPPCIVSPTTAQDVSTVIKVLTDGEGLPFAVKGSGHSPYGGYANIHDGITISMAEMSAISISEDHSLVHVGSGNRWLSVFEYLDNVGGVAVAGGENGNVGAGGLLIGGGISILGPRAGWSCDNVVNFEVVLADGSIVNANQSSHSDLWKALKGGTNNFGIVTQYDITTVQMDGGVWGGSISLDMDDRNKTFDAFVQVANATDYDPYAYFTTEFAFKNDAWSLEQVMSYSKPSSGVPDALRPFADLNLQNSSSLKNMNLSTMANEGSSKPSYNILLSTGTYKIDTGLLDFILSENQDTVANLSAQDPDLVWELSYQPIPAVWIEESTKLGGNSLGIEDVQDNSFVILITSLCSNDTLSSVVRSAVSKLQSSIDAYATAKDLKRDLVFLNYAGIDQDPLASYGKDNLQQLKDVAAKYDPKTVFQRLVPGGYKISKAGAHSDEGLEIEPI